MGCWKSEVGLAAIARGGRSIALGTSSTRTCEGGVGACSIALGTCSSRSVALGNGGGSGVLLADRGLPPFRHRQQEGGAQE